MEADRSDASKSASLKAAGDSAGEKPNWDVTDGMAQCPDTKSEWVEIKLVDSEGSAVSNMECIITDPDGQEHETKTDSYGLVRVEGISKGECKVTFPTIDRNSWEKA